jgi:hypothetical protein
MLGNKDNMVRETNFKFLILALSLAITPISGAIDQKAVKEKTTKFVKNHPEAIVAPVVLAAMYCGYCLVTSKKFGKYKVAKIYKESWTNWKESADSFRKIKVNPTAAKSVALFGITSELLGSCMILGAALAGVYKLA